MPGRNRLLAVGEAHAEVQPAGGAGLSPQGLLRATRDRLAQPVPTARGGAALGRVQADGVLPGPVYQAPAAGGGLCQRWRRERGDEEGEGKTAVVVVADGAPAGVLALRDEPRGDAAAGVAALARLGIRSVMLTGDNARTGAAIAKDLGLDVKAELLPDDKLREIGSLRSAGSVVIGW